MFWPIVMHFLLPQGRDLGVILWYFHSTINRVQFSYIYSEVYLLNLWWTYQKIPKYFPRLKRFLSSLKMTVSKEFQPANAPSHLWYLWACQINVVWKVETATPITKRAIYWFYILLTCAFGFKLKKAYFYYLTYFSTSYGFYCTFWYYL